MIRSRLAYHAPTSLSEALALLADGEASVLAGGTWLVPLMSRGERSPSTVVDLRRLGLRGISEAAEGVEIGATTTYSELIASDIVRTRLPLLWRAACGITGGAQIRNLATIGGSACFAIPTSDMPTCLVALGAVLRVDDASGQRGIPAGDFFLDAFRTALAPDGLLTSITIPVQHGASGYCKFKLCEGSWPIVTAAAVDGGAGPAVTLGGVFRTPARLVLGPGAESDIAAALGAQPGEPWSDELAPGSYRAAIAPVLARRALDQMREEPS